VATYNLTASDAGYTVTMSNTSPNLVYIPTDAVVNFAAGTQITIIQANTGTTSVAASSAVTTTLSFYSPTSVTATAAIKGRWAGLTLVKTAANTWVALGNIT
jgi:hypothetical protein